MPTGPGCSNGIFPFSSNPTSVGRLTPSRSAASWVVNRWACGATVTARPSRIASTDWIRIEATASGNRTSSPCGPRSSATPLRVERRRCARAGFAARGCANLCVSFGSGGSVGSMVPGGRSSVNGRGTRCNRSVSCGRGGRPRRARLHSLGRGDTATWSATSPDRTGCPPGPTTCSSAPPEARPRCPAWHPDQSTARSPPRNAR